MEVEEESDFSDRDLTGESESDFSDMDLTAHKTKTPKRGLTRLPKMRTAFTNSGGKKHKVTFDELQKFSGEYRSEFSSFFGDLVREHVGFRFLAWKTVPTEVKDKLWEEITRFYDIDACRRRFVMTRLGDLLRNFRRKVYAGYIVPNLGKPKKLARIPKRYRSMVEQTDWDKFVTYTQSDEFKDVSNKRKTARSKYVYDHHLGRGGYAYLREKLVQNNELSVDEIPSRALMWRKARENKNGEYKNVDVKDIADKIIDTETQIKDGSVNLDPGTDALTLVFGKEKGGYLKGVGYGVTSSRYWQSPRTKGSSKERIAQLEFQLHNERLERGKKDEQIKTLSMQMAETNNTLNQVLAHLAAQGQTLQICSLSADKMSQTQVNSLDKHDRSKHKANATASKIVQKEMAPTVKSMNNSTGSKDNTNVTTSNISSKVVQTEVTSHANTSKMVQKEMITENVKTRKKGVLSTQETSLLGTSSQLESQENIHNTHSTNVLEIKCTLYTINMNNCVAYGTIHLSTGKQSIHGVPLQDNCYRVSIDKVVKEATFLPVESCEVKTVGDALNTFVAWPKYLVKTSQKIPNLSSIQTQNTTTQVAKKQKMCFTTLDDIKKQGARRTRKTL
ncbi:putative transposase, Ptta/En/Spm, plant [Helianthus annuus]|nr:uncharacterized protein LOC110901225 [Helianthus annuus]KAJ0476881.1 putative transposase, Ptta/En/Spm, plant [Helianthus annuus]KAJ0481225.1 putative transposase, Ptta/En/Spm, plant [Helianthus annuus]KAJ0497705.1 putative transposase, Ptta/En/Spm, plant [Helianthus annuus]KAJ0663709.1 putative transposase, Ptta/En/Spm, plant [Helianthus annuus]KAJ0671204.1 putative transposase, Ptta/En/Spm, plant [Helianthus annuus]